MYLLKNKTTGVPQYFFDPDLQIYQIYNTCAVEDVTAFYSRTDVFKYSLFLDNIKME